MRITLVVAMLAGILLLLTACSTQQEGVINAESYKEENIQQEPPDPCERIECSVGEQCVDGSCVCKKDLKKCNNACVPETQCCTDSDCGENKTCSQGKCAIIPQTCKFNEKFDIAKESCTCVTGTKFCEEQQKCIPERNCCRNEDCKRVDDKCSPTTYAANVCVQDPLSHCKSIPEASQAVFPVESGTITIKVNNITEDGKTQFETGGKQLNASVSKQITLSKNTKLLIDDIRIFGGTCKD